MKDTEEFAREVLDETLLCTRVWDAWLHGTMSDSDFLEARDDDQFLQQVISMIDARVQEARDDERAKIVVELENIPFWRTKDGKGDGFDIASGLDTPEQTLTRTGVMQMIQNKTEYSIHEFLQRAREEDATWRAGNPNGGS